MAEPMIIYNITTLIQHAIADEWLQWMQQTHIPQVMQTGCFSRYQVVRLLETDETEGRTYAVQYYAGSKALYNRYAELYAPVLRKAGMDKWGDKTISFPSLMEIVH